MSVHAGFNWWAKPKQSFSQILQSAGRLTESESQKLGVKILSYVNCIASSAEANDAMLFWRNHVSIYPTLQYV